MKNIVNLLIVASTATLVLGCSHTPKVTPETAPKLSSWQLCKGLMNASFDDAGMQLAMNEMKSRGESCDEWRQIVL